MEHNITVKDFLSGTTSNCLASSVSSKVVKHLYVRVTILTVTTRKSFFEVTGTGQRAQRFEDLRDAIECYNRIKT